MFVPDTYDVYDVQCTDIAASVQALAEYVWVWPEEGAGAFVDPLYAIVNPPMVLAGAVTLVTLGALSCTDGATMICPLPLITRATRSDWPRGPRT
jgi:hypothetical protein